MVEEDGGEKLLRDEFFHNSASPDYEKLKLHKGHGAAVTVYDPETGAKAYVEYHNKGKHQATSYLGPKDRIQARPFTKNK